MTENLAQQQLETTADNIVPFPASTATDATGNERLYTAEELKTAFAPTAQTTRTVRDLVAKVREAYHWLDEIEFKRGDKFTQFCFDQIKAMKDSGLTQKQWIAEIQKLAPKPSVEPKAIATYQQPTADPQPAGGLIKPEILNQPSPVTALDRIRCDRYAVSNFGSTRLANAQERAKTQRFNLEDTRDRVRQAFMGLAVQTAEEMTAEELERQSRLEQVYQESYAETLEELQVRNAAKQDAVSDYSVMKQQVMGKVATPDGSSVSA